MEVVSHLELLSPIVLIFLKIGSRYLRFKRASHVFRAGNVMIWTMITETVLLMRRRRRRLQWWWWWTACVPECIFWLVSDYSIISSSGCGSIVLFKILKKCNVWLLYKIAHFKDVKKHYMELLKLLIIE